MATKEANLKIVVDAQNNTTGAFNTLKDNLDSIKKSHEGLISAMRGVGIAGTAAFAGLGLVTKGAVEAGAEFEQTQVAFTTMIGSAERAKSILADLSQFAATTPFQLGQLQEASKQLLAYGTAADDLIPTLKMLGDIAAGVGMDKLPNLILAFGQVKAATHLTGMEVRQFTEAGVPILQALVDQMNKTGGATVMLGATSEKTRAKVDALTDTLEKQNNRLREMQKNGNTTSAAYRNLKIDIENTRDKLAKLGPVSDGVAGKMTYTVSQIQEMISAGKISFEQVKEALASMTGEGGRFYDLMSKQSETLAGQWSNLQDAISLTARSIGTELLPYLKPVVEKLIEIVHWIGQFVQDHPKLSAAILIGTLAFAALLAVLLPISLALPGLILLFTGLGTAFAFVTALSAPLLLAIAAVVAGLLILITQGYTTKEAWQDVWLGIKLIAVDACNAIISTVQGMINFIIEGVNNTIRMINNVISLAQKVPGVGKFLPKISTIKPLELGGINADAIVANDLAMRGSTAGSTPAVTVTGNVLLSKDVATQIGDLIMKQLKLSNAI